ncbi:MAG: hypothetical protein ABR921_13685, partial [Candidatus Sulfotelmatobacter sp.]
MKSDFKLRRAWVMVILLAASCTLLAQTFAQAPAFDLVVINGHIIDGTGSPWYSGDVGIREG